MNIFRKLNKYCNMTLKALVHLLSVRHRQCCDARKSFFYSHFVLRRIFLVLWSDRICSLSFPLKLSLNQSCCFFCQHRETLNKLSWCCFSVSTENTERGTSREVSQSLMPRNTSLLQSKQRLKASGPRTSEDLLMLPCHKKSKTNMREAVTCRNTVSASGAVRLKLLFMFCWLFIGI